MQLTIVTQITAALFPALVGMAFVSFRRKPGQRQMPSLGQGGGILFLQTWAVTVVCVLIFSSVFVAAGVSETYVSAFAQLVLPAICAFLFVKKRLTQ